MASEGVPSSRSEGGDGSAAHCRTQKKMNTVHKYIISEFVWIFVDLCESVVKLSLNCPEKKRPQITPI